MGARSPTFTVAITGHRPNRLGIGVARVARRLELALTALRAGSSGHRRVAVSALAEGADRLFAEAALTLGYELHALLPFESADYEVTFADPGTTATYRALRARAATVRELPGALADSKAAYEAVGRATVDACDVLIAVWDGKPAAGRGGTPEIIDYALAGDRPVIWVDAALERLPRLLRQPTASGPRQVPLAKLAGRAKPLSELRLRRLAATVTTGSS